MSKDCLILYNVILTRTSCKYDLGDMRRLSICQPIIQDPAVCGKSEEFQMSEVIRQNVPVGTHYVIKNKEELKYYPIYRNALELDEISDNVITVLRKAKIIQIYNIRSARDANWAVFDKKWMIAQRNDADLTALIEERNKLMNIPQVYQLLVDAASTVEELMLIWPPELLQYKGY